MAGEAENRPPHGASQRAGDDAPSGATGRDRYRDNDDARDPIAADDRGGTKPDTRFEARGDARENVGNHSRGTGADPTGPAGNDRQASRHDRDPQSESFDRDLKNDDRTARG